MKLKTQEQRAADAALEAAVGGICDAYDLIAGNLLLDYMVVIEGATFDDNGEVDQEYYGLAYRHGNARSTVALGLIEKARHMLLNVRNLANGG